MQVRDLMAKEVLTAPPDASIEDVAKNMQDRSVGSVVIVDGGKIAGIFTERDFLRAAADGAQPRTTKVRDHMTTETRSVPSRTDVVEAGRIMSEHGFRHLPVVDKGDLVGMVSMRDLLAWSVREMHTAEELAQIEKGQEVLTLAVEGNNNK